MRWFVLMGLMSGMLGGACTAGAEPPPTPAEARSAMVRAVSFFCHEVAMDGGYLWRYSADLAKREGEGKITTRTVWVQPPGTPAVGLALVQAHALTGERVCLNGAIEAAHTLVRGQLQSGGWTYRIELEPKARERYAYRVDGAPRDSARDQSTLDDNTTQAALLFMMRVDQALAFQDEAIHESADYALRALLKAQFDCGGWSQAFDASLDTADCTASAASIPPSWSREYPGHQRYWYQPTLNDGLMSDLLPVLFEATRIYDQPEFRAAALRGGEFLLRAQLPEPQPGWAQQYSGELQPIWARKFEPPAVTGGESRGVLRALIGLYRETGDPRWLAPTAPAVAYYRRSELPGGKLARFYELTSNRPLYFTEDYRLTYDGSEVPDHYAFTVSSWVDGIEQELAEVLALDAASLRAADEEPPARCSPAEARVLIDGLDERGAWVENGSLRYAGKADSTDRIIDCATFAGNLIRLAGYVGTP